eukprot:CAMPEP_0172312838 /NCGR_PEP_ID=MMETSP1058-20130122/18628_1 /TAXON_ID=83371 /ORGANISM="Detonula confervacea, Strain CCMP 353" /LENGTH=306 /DNA_ID=CAMNT_0013026393 /DNA_START=258 /DNA_END=1175 /DNA_ORIENTATION=+
MTNHLDEDVPNDESPDNSTVPLLPRHQPTPSPTMNYSLSELDPPPSRLEVMRDQWLKFLGGKIHFWLGVSVMILIIADGAFFFFLLIGAQQMCSHPSPTDCDPRNYWYNFSIQLLNVLFTYLAIISLPWRISNAAHLFGGKRKSTSGFDAYGQPCKEIWFHIRQRRRRFIVICLIGNSFTQYANQATRIVYYSFELQNTFPGYIWTNVFFVSSMAFAAIGGFTQLYEENKLRKEHPERFPPDILETAYKYFQAVVCRKKVEGGVDTTVDGDEENAREEVDEEEERRRFLQSIREWLKNVRTSLDMW